MPRKTPADPLAGRIFTIRGQRVILDSDLARLYGVATKRFNEAVKRNVARFPKDFFSTDRGRVREGTLAGGCRDCIQHQHLRVPSELVAICDQFNGNSPRTELPSTRLHRARGRHGRECSPQSEGRADERLRCARFVAQREALATNQSVLRRLAEIDRTLFEHDAALRALWGKLRPLLMPPPEKPGREMGFHTGIRKP